MPDHAAADLLTRALVDDQPALLAEWESVLSQELSGRREAISDGDLHRECESFLTTLSTALSTAGPGASTNGAAWAPMRDLIEEFANARAHAGFTARETALFVFSLKRPLFTRLRAIASEPTALADALWAATELVDDLGLRASDVYAVAREDVIRRQADDMLELSTPVVKLWPGVVGVPLIGTLDSARTQVVMESLLERIVATDSPMAIIDITGVTTVDTLVAQHLLKTVAAARLMGAECIISGIRPQIAQTIVQLGLDLSGVETRATLADALLLALKRMGFTIARTATA